MKQAYVSIVTRWGRDLRVEELRRIDAALSSCARGHEIVIVAAPDDLDDPGLIALRQSADLASPLSLVVTWHNASHDAAMIAGMSRAAGDFVLEWDAAPRDLSHGLLQEALDATDEGVEIVEIVPAKTHWVSHAFYRTANAFRPRSAPLQPSVARLLSRRTLDLALTANHGVSNRLLMVADMGLPRMSLVREVQHRHDRGYSHRWGEAVTVLTRGTRAASILPTAIAVCLALFTFAAALFALGLFFTTGQAPEGWTALMVVVGLGLSAVLGFLGLLWEHIDSLARSQTQPRDATSSVIVIPPVMSPPVWTSPPAGQLE